MLEVSARGLPTLTISTYLTLATLKDRAFLPTRRKSHVARLRPCLVPRVPVSSPSFLHFGFEDMTAPTTKLAAHDHFTLAKRGLKVVVEILDYLERPLSGKDVSADQFGLYLLREIVTAGFTWLLDRFVEHQVGTPDQLVKVVRASTCTFDSLKGFGELACSGDLYALTLGSRGRGHCDLRRNRRGARDLPVYRGQSSLWLNRYQKLSIEQ